MSLLKDRWKLYKLARRQRKLDEETERKHAEAEEKKDDGILERWYEDYAIAVYEEIEISRKKIISDALLKEADELNLPRPSYDEKSKWESEDEFSSTAFGLVLTPEAMTDLRSVIRKEKRERRETAEWWVKLLGGVITILTGLVGALIGLVSVWKHK